MAIDTITPAATSLVEPGDSFSFTVDNTYTAMTIEVETSGGWEYAYDGTLGGAQAGYTVSVTVSGGRHIFVVTRDAGWNLSPTSIRVIEDETGASATTTTNYVLATATSYPQTSTPYYINPSMTNAKFTDLLDTPASYAGEALKVYRVNAGETALEAVASGAGDVIGPGSAVDSNVALFDTTTGKLIKDGGVGLTPLTNVENGSLLWEVEDVAGANPTAATYMTSNTNNTGSVTVLKFRDLTYNGQADVSLFLASLTADTKVMLIAQPAVGGSVKNVSGTIVSVVDNSGYTTVTITNDNIAFGSTIVAGEIYGLYAVPAGGGGVTDHGALTGLADDDHTQYVQGALTGVVAPGMTTGDGYRLGTVYVDTSNNLSYNLVDATVGANVWSHGDHRFLSWNSADSHTQYVLGAGTRAQDAAFFTERPDHVNAPALTKGELWLRSDAPQQLVFTDEAGADKDLVTMLAADEVIWRIPFVTATGDGKLGTASWLAADLNGNLNVAAGAINMGGVGHGVEMTEGSSLADTPGTGQGAFWVRDDDPNVPMFTDDAGVDIQLGRTYVTASGGARFTGTTASTWYGHSSFVHTGDGASATTAAGTGTDPSMTHNFIGYDCPGAGTVVGVRFHYTLNVASDDGNLALYMASITDGTTTTVKTNVANVDFATYGDTISVSYIVDGGNPAQAIAAGDILKLWRRAGSTNQSTSSNCSYTALIALD